MTNQNSETADIAEPVFATTFSEPPESFDSDYFHLADGDNEKSASSSTSGTTTVSNSRRVSSASNHGVAVGNTLPLNSFDKYPDLLCIVLDEINCTEPRGRSFVRISYLSEVKKTVPNKDVSSHFLQTFEFNCSFHSILFDVVKIDVFEHRTIGTNVHLGRTTLALADLLHSPGELTKVYPLRPRRTNSNFTTPSVAGHERDSLIAKSVTEIKVTLKLLYKKDRRKSTLNRSMSLPFESVNQQTAQTKGLKPLLSRSSSTSVVLNSQNMPPPTSLLGARSVLQLPSEYGGKRNSVVSVSASSFYGTEVGDFEVINPTDASIFKALVEEEEEMLENSVLDSPKKKGFNFRIISEETMSTLKECNVIYNAYFKSGWQISKLEFMSAAMVLQKYYTEQPNLLTHVRPTDTKPLEQILHYLKFSMASYGSALMTLWGHGQGVKDVVRAQSDRKAVCNICKLDPVKDMIKWQFGKNQVYKPKYYICRDPETNAIVVVLRGTLNIHDAVTDLMCQYEPFQGGLVHKGILKCAQVVIEESLEVMKEAVKKFNASGLYFVGHSLGGAVSSLTCMIMQDRLQEFRSLTTDPSFDILSFSMGPPPSVSLDITMHGKQCIYTVVNEFDLVSRLSYGSCIVMKEILKSIVEAKKDPVLRLMSKKARNHHITEMIDGHRKHWLHEKSHTKLFIPGTIYYLYKAKNAKLGPLPSKEMRSQIHVEVSRPENFVDLIVRKNAASHHVPSSYDKRLRATLLWLAATDGLPEQIPSLQ